MTWSFLNGNSVKRGVIFLICFLRYKVIPNPLEVENTAKSCTAFLENLYLLGLFNNLPGTDF